MIKPLDIRKVGDQELLVVWEDGQRSLYSAPYLQLRCQCAKCVDEITGQQLIKETDIDPDVKFMDIIPVGSYAVRFHWSRGCQTGIYAFDYLRSISPEVKQVED